MSQIVTSKEGSHILLKRPDGHTETTLGSMFYEEGKLHFTPEKKSIHFTLFIADQQIKSNHKSLFPNDFSGAVKCFQSSVTKFNLGSLHHIVDYE